MTSFRAPRVLTSEEGAFRVVDTLRPGGYCELYVAEGIRGPHTGSRCVLKTLRSDRADDPEVFQTLVREGAILSRLDHPNIVQLYGTVILDDRPWLVIEFVEGISVAMALERLMFEGRAMPKEVVFSVLLQALEALAYIHAATDPFGEPLELRHQDLSPGNLLLTRDGGVKLLDFGLSGWTHQKRFGKQGIVYGTPGFLAPEQIRGEPFSGKGDVFAAGLIGMAMLGDGSSPFARDTVQESMLATLHGNRWSAHDLVPDIPRGIAEVLEACLSTNVAPRPSASRAAMLLLSTLERIGAGVASRAQMQAFLASLERGAPLPDAAEPARLFSTTLLSEGFDLELPDPTFKAVGR